MSVPGSSLSRVGDVDVKGMVARSHSVDARNSQFNEVHGDGYQVNNENHGPQTNQRSNSGDARYDRLIDNDVHDHGHQTNNENHGPETNQPSNPVDARYGKFSEVYGNGYQINNDVHGRQINNKIHAFQTINHTLNHYTQDNVHAYQTNQTTINHYTQDNFDSSATLKYRQAFANWLSPLNFRQRQSEVRDTWREGTGGWVLDDEKFKEWQRGDVKTLWCPGIPGAGKTVLASYIINHLEKNKEDDVAVVYAYCSYNDRSMQTACNLVASLLKQLVQDFPQTFGRIKGKFKRHREQDFRPTLSDLRDALIDEIKRYSQVFIVVDALDEVTEDGDTRSEMLRCLQSLEGSLLVTSRDISSIKAVLREPLRMDIRAHEDDVRNYITDRICLQTQLNEMLGNDAFRGEFIERLTKEGQGMFLLSRLHVDLLVHKLTRNEVRRALENLPKEVGSAYDATMKRIDEGRHRELVKKAMTWIVFASRPLFFTELQEALAFSTGLRKISADDLMAKATILDACAGILIADGENDVCRLVHYSAHEYLVKRGDWAFPDPEVQITSICLDSLSMLSPQEAHPVDVPHNQGFIVYARQNWGHHARSVEKTVPMVIRDFLCCEANVENALQFMHGPDSRYFDGGSALHLCAYFGLEQTTDYLFGNDVAVDRRDNQNRTPLFVAAEEGHDKVVKLLLDRGHDVNSRDDYDVTPLLAAADEGHLEIVKLLLARNDIDVDSKDSEGWTPLKRAAHQGHLEIVKLLLARNNVDVDSKTNNGWTSLWSAASQGHVEIVKLLLARDEVDVDSKDNEGWTPLLSAASQGHVEIVKLLLARDEVDVDSKNNDGLTPLTSAADQGHLETVKLLLARDEVDVDPKDKYSGTPLKRAAHNGHVEIVKLLLARNEVDVESKGKEGWTPLLSAASQGYVEIVKLLLARDKVDVDTKNNNGWTPLSSAADQGHVEIVKLLLARDKVDVDSKDNYGCTPLSRAAEQGHVEIVKLLLARDKVDVDSKDNYGCTPLSRAAEQGHVEIVKFLLAKDDVDVNSKDNDGRTPFWYAAQEGRVEVVKLMLAIDGVDVDSQDHEGWTPLSRAVHQGKAEVVELLLARHDVEVNSHKDCDSTPSTLTANQGEAQLPLSETCMPLAFSFRPPYHKELARLFVKRASANFNVNWKDQSGFTPLWIVTWHGDEKTAELLLACGGIDVNMFPSGSSVPPLWAASYRAFSEVDEILDTSSSIYQGADSNDINGGKSNDLQSVDNPGFQKGNEAVLRLLLKRFDVDLNWRNKNGETLLSIAAKNGCESLVKQLLFRDDIDVNLQDDKGDLPLHHAVRSGHKGVAALLVACDDIALNLKNALGQTPLHCAIMSQGSEEQELWDACTQEEIVQLLLAHGDIRVDLEDDSGSTPIMLARSMERLGVVKLIEQHLDASPGDEVTAQFEGVERNYVNVRECFSFQDDTSETYYTALDEMSDTYYTPLDEVLEITEQ